MSRREPAPGGQCARSIVVGVADEHDVLRRHREHVEHRTQTLRSAERVREQRDLGRPAESLELRLT